MNVNINSKTKYTSYQANNENSKKFREKFENLSRTHNKYQVWSDFIVMTACAFSNGFESDKNMFENREKMFMDCSKKYNKDENSTFAEMLGLLMLAYYENPEQDFLGEIYCTLQLNKGGLGQVFTPYNVARLIAEMQISHIKERLEKERIVSVADHSCGSGCLLIALANSAINAGVNYLDKIKFIAQDIDLIAGLMCYIQLSILGCKATVKIGDSLAEPITKDAVYDETVWVTPMASANTLLVSMMKYQMLIDKNNSKTK